MFFDEYNNFVIMSKNYVMPEQDERATDLKLIGSNNQSTVGAIRNKSITDQLPNIISISSQDKKVYNDGKINYTSRYIQRSYGTVKQSALVDQEKPGYISQHYFGKPLEMTQQKQLMIKYLNNQTFYWLHCHLILT